jgi:hypothetical protein
MILPCAHWAPSFGCHFDLSASYEPEYKVRDADGEMAVDLVHLVIIDGEHFRAQGSPDLPGQFHNPSMMKNDNTMMRPDNLKLLKCSMDSVIFEGLSENFSIVMLKKDN